MLIVGLMLLGFIVLDIAALRFGAQSSNGERRSTWW
jgi:hypothetical protein